jgi:multimeric flavodoxin WrbA
MKIEYYTASRFGNGTLVAEEFKKAMAARGIEVAVHHVRDVKPTQLAAADLYVFSAPGRMGRPIRKMRRFLEAITLPAGTRYAVLTTEVAPRPDKKTGVMPSDEEIAKWQRIRPIMTEILDGKGMVKVAEDRILVLGLRGPLEDGWKQKTDTFASLVPTA